MAKIAENVKEVMYVVYDFDEVNSSKRHFRAKAPKMRYEFTEDHPLGIIYKEDIEFFSKDKRFKVFETLSEAKKVNQKRISKDSVEKPKEPKKKTKGSKSKK